MKKMLVTTASAARGVTGGDVGAEYEVVDIMQVIVKAAAPNRAGDNSSSP